LNLSDLDTNPFPKPYELLLVDYTPITDDSAVDTEYVPGPGSLLKSSFNSCLPSKRLVVAPNDLLEIEFPVLMNDEN
jgi:hypothetical protein